MLIKIVGTSVSIAPSIHRLTLNYQLKPALLSAASAAEEVVFERDLAATLTSPPPAGPRAAEVVPQVPALEKLWAGNAVGRKRSELDQLSVGEVAQIVEESTDTNSFGLFFEYGIDMQIWNAVQPARRAWVEAIEELQSPLSVYPEAEQLADLKYACDLEKRKSDFLAVLQAWETGDLRRLESSADQLYSRTPTRAQAVLAKRNPVMLDAICQRIAANRRALFVLGAAHLARADGIVMGLEQRGFNIHIVC